MRQDSQQKAFFQNYSKLNFTQELNIYDWLYNLNYETRLSNRWHLKITEQFQTTLQRIVTKDLWKDRQDFRLILGYPVNKRLSIDSEFYSHVLSDPFAGFDNDIIFHSGTFRAKYQVTPTISISPQVSSKWQTQLEQSDSGIGFGLDARLDEINLHGYRSDLWLLGEQDIFPQRKNENLKLRYRIQRRFYESTADTVVVIFDRLRRDSFDADAAGVFVRKLTQTRRGIENRLSYRLSPFSHLYLRNAITSTSFIISNLRDAAAEVGKDDSGFESRHSVSINVQKPTWFGNLSWNFRSRSRDDRRPRDVIVDPFRSRHPSLGFDTDEVLVNLGLSAGMKISSSDSLGIYSSVSRFQFDTSDTTNPNDHDQLKWQFTVSHTHDFGSTLRLVWRANVFLNHFVFISSNISAGNNWERVFQLVPVVIYKPSNRFTFRQSFTVRAKYQTFDFDDPITSNRNTVNRQFSMSNSTNIALTARSWLEMDVNVEMAEQGKLFYSLWRQRLALSWRNQEVELLFRHRFSPNLVLSAGGSLFHQIRWNHRVVPDSGLKKTVRDKHTNFGPLVQVSYQPSSRVQFLFSGNIQVVNASRRDTEYINNFDVNLNWLF